MQEKLEVVDKDMLDLELKPGDATDRSRRKTRSRGNGATVISGVIILRHES